VTRDEARNVAVLLADEHGTSPALNDREGSCLDTAGGLAPH
jgi:hypothetical protein